MLEEHNCEARVYDRFGGSNCSRRGVVFEDDKWWCRQHSPSATKARREAAKRRSDEDIRQHEQGWKQAHERERRANCFNELVAALEAALFQMEIYPDHTYYAFGHDGRSKRHWCDLCDRIDDARAALAKAKEVK